MREILFRGKQIDNGEWIYGDVIQFPMHGIVRIIEQNSDDGGSYGDSEIDCDTLGQYTGLTDKNGRKIFEGDVLKGKFSNYVIRFDEEERAFVYGSSRKGGYIHSLAKYLIGDYKNLRVIGNIHDNPELITCGANSEK